MDDGRSRSGGCLALCVLATLINPYGLEYWRYILGATTMDRATITEWSALDLTSVFSVYIFASLGVVLVGSLVRGGRRPHPEGIAMIAVALAATLSSQRIMNFLFVLLAIYGAGSAKAFGEWIATRTPRYTTALRRVFAVSFSAGIIFATVSVVQNVGRIGREGLSYDTHPVSAVDWLSTMGNGGRLLVYLNEGSFALWRLFPEYRVSMDGRYEETYPQETLDLVVSALLPDHPDHTKSLRSVAPDYILVQDTARAGAFGSDWNAVYRDDEFVVLAHDHADPRRDPETRPADVEARILMSDAKPILRYRYPGAHRSGKAGGALARGASVERAHVGHPHHLPQRMGHCRSPLLDPTAHPDDGPVLGRARTVRAGQQAPRRVGEAAP